MMGILRLFFNSIFLFLIFLAGVFYYMGYLAGQDKIESQAVANGYGKYVKTFKECPDGSRTVEYVFYWTDKIPERAVTAMTKPSRLETFYKNSGIQRIVQESKQVQPDRIETQNDKASDLRNRSLESSPSKNLVKPERDQ